MSSIFITSSSILQPISRRDSIPKVFRRQFCKVFIPAVSAVSVLECSKYLEIYEDSLVVLIVPLPEYIPKVYIPNIVRCYLIY